MTLSPQQIEQESFAIIGRELAGRDIPPEHRDIVTRVIHATADFDFADTLFFSPNATQRAHAALSGGAAIVTDTRMAQSGINRRAAARLGCHVLCFMDDEDVARQAKERGVTRASASMDKALALGDNVIFAIGNAPTALLRLHQLMQEGRVNPQLILATPVGFVNVVESKESIARSRCPHIIARGRKGGSTVAAAICNALLYQLDPSRGQDEGKEGAQ